MKGIDWAGPAGERHIIISPAYRTRSVDDPALCHSGCPPDPRNYRVSVPPSRLCDRCTAVLFSAAHLLGVDM
jgi:hypothetical protein